MPKTKTERLRAMGSARPVGVDRENNVLRGYVVAQLGPFKSEGRGEFNQAGLEEIVRLGNSTKQLKSRFGHATMCDSALGKYLGRPQNFFMGEAKTADGKTVPAVRADLHFDQTALGEPPGGGKPLGVYVMDLAENNPGALSSSLVLKPKKTYRKNEDGTLTTDENGDPLPPLWTPEQLMGSDIVDTGDAVDDLLSTDALPNGYLWEAADLLDGLFPDKTRDELHTIILGWATKYLDGRFGPRELLFVHNSVVEPGEPDWGSVNKEELPRIAFAGKGEADKKSSWSYPHHWVKGGSSKDANGVLTDGTLYLHKGGLNAAWAAAHGARSGEAAPSAVIAHLEMHRKALGLDDGKAGAMPADVLQAAFAELGLRRRRNRTAARNSA